MYASNEDEFNQVGDDWVFLRQTLSKGKTFDGSVNITDDDQINSTSSSTDVSSKSDRSESISSISSAENEPTKNNEQVVNQDKNPLDSNPVIDSQTGNESLTTSELQIEAFPSDASNKSNTEHETTPVINEYDSMNTESEINDQTISSNTLQHACTGGSAINNDEENSCTEESEYRSFAVQTYRPRKTHLPIVYGIFVVLFILQFILVRSMLSQRQTINQMTEDLRRTKQMLSEIKSVSIQSLQLNLERQLEHKFQILINQNEVDHEQEKFLLNLQIEDLREQLRIVETDLTNYVHKLSDKDQHLENEVSALEHRLHMVEQNDHKDNETCSERVDDVKSPVDELLGNIIKRTASIAEDTSINLSNIFQQWSTSLSDVVEHRHEYIEDSKRKLSQFANSQTVERLQAKLRDAVENLTSSMRQAQSTYSATWVGSRAEYREQARMDKEKKDGQSFHQPWRWTFERSSKREQMRQQTPVTKKHSPKKECPYRPGYEFPVHQWCTIKNWMGNFFYP